MCKLQGHFLTLPERPEPGERRADFNRLCPDDSSAGPRVLSGRGDTHHGTLLLERDRCRASGTERTQENGTARHPHQGSNVPKSKPAKPPHRRDRRHLLQPSQEEINEPIEVPEDLIELPLKERLEEGARRLLTTVRIRRVDRSRG